MSLSILKFRPLGIALTFVGAGLAAWFAAYFSWLPVYYLFDRISPGERLDDMSLVGFVPYLAALPIAAVVTAVIHRRKWPILMAFVMGGCASAVVTFANGFVLMRSLTP